MTEREELRRLRRIVGLVPLRMWRSDHHRSSFRLCAVIVAILGLNFALQAIREDWLGAFGFAFAVALWAQNALTHAEKWRKWNRAEERAADD